jgi:phage terminase large subunit
MEIDIDIPAPFVELFAPSKQWRHLLYYGGRSSGKSTQVALSRLISGSKKRERGLCTREFQNSISESVHQLLRDLIDKYKLHDWEAQREVIRNKKTGSEIYFKGLHNNAQSIKSTEGLDWAWVEEAQSVSSESIETLIPTIRKPGSYLIWTMNRQTENDPVWEKLATKPDELTYIRKVNSDAIESLLSDEIIHEREMMRKNNPEFYEHVWLGEPLTSNTGSVFGKQLAQAREDGRIGSVPYDATTGVYTAWDLGIGDATAIWFFQRVGREIHFIDHYEASGEDLGHYISVLNNKPYNYAKHFLPHDAKQRELQTNMTRVDFFAQNGINNVEVLRPTSFQVGNDDINLIARPKLSLCWFDAEKCKRGLECLRAYHYDYDAKNNLLKSQPEHDWSSHSSSAFIYALMANTEQLETQYHGRLKTFVPKEFLS